MIKEELERNPIKTVEDYRDKIKELKENHDAFLAALDEVLEARKYIIHEPIYLQEIADMSNLKNVRRLEQAHDKLRQLKMWNGNRS